MNAKQTVLAFSIGLGLWGTSLAETPVVIKEPEIRTIITDAGYGDPTLVVQEEDYWRVTSIDSKTGDEVTLFVNPEGNIVGAAEVARARVTTLSDAAALSEPLTEATVAASVRDAGFNNVHDIDYLDGEGVWKAEADDTTGEDFELHVDARTGQIVHIEDD